MKRKKEIYRKKGRKEPYLFKHEEKLWEKEHTNKFLRQSTIETAM